jgi:hypothetical protein
MFNIRILKIDIYFNIYIYAWKTGTFEKEQKKTKR